MDVELEFPPGRDRKLAFAAPLEQIQFLNFPSLTEKTPDFRKNSRNRRASKSTSDFFPPAYFFLGIPRQFPTHGSNSSLRFSALTDLRLFL